MSDHRIVALCAGYGGLEAAVTAGLGGEVVAFAESDPYAARVFSAHHPAAPNVGDVMTADWEEVLETYRPNVVAAGFPCRNISNAGDRTGIEGEWSRVWKGVAEAVRVLRPGLVVLENVSAILRRGIDTVVADLAAIGYDARWTCLRASEVGAPHPRDRWICIAHPADADPDQLGRYRWAGDLPGSTGRLESEDPGHEVAAAPAGLSLLPTLAARDWKSGASNLLGRNARPLNEIVVNGLDDRWVAGDGTDYGPAIRRWEKVTGRAAPCPTESGTRGNRRLSPAFTEWMMGLPEGWVTDVPDVPRREQLRILGNGAVPHQMYEGLTRLFTMDVDGEDDMSTTQDKPRGKCTGCAFEYQLAAARSGEHKGSLVIRKHNSRTGPGLCPGAGLPPREATTDLGESVEGPRIGADEAVEMNTRHLAERRKNPELPETDVHRGRKEDCTESNCVPPAEPKKHCRPGGCRGCCGCSAVCTKNPCGDPEGYGMHELTNRAIEALERRTPEQKMKTAARMDAVASAALGLPRDPKFTDPEGYAEAVGKVTGFAAQAEAIVSGAVPVVERTVQAIAAAVGEATGFTAQVEAIASGAVPVVDPVVAAVPEMFADPAAATALSFADPAPVAAEMAPVSGQPEPDRDGWGRYVIHKQPHTRATSFAKLGSSTYALGEWNERMLIKGLTERPDLLAMAHGLDVRADKTRLNAIADDAQTHAGNKVAANIGTSLHKFTERLDAGLITLDEVPPMWRARCKQYLDAVAAYGLRTRADWIERTTAVRADQVSAPLPVAGTLDRIWEMPNGDLVIGDLKSGRDLSYSWVEIAVQLALYAHGVNTHGLFDWRTKSWEGLRGGGFRQLSVRTDFAIVMHLPAEGDGCDLYRVDLVKGWEYAQVSGRVQSRQKDESIAAALTTLDVSVSPERNDCVRVPAHLLKAGELVSAAAGGQELSQIYEYAQVSGLFSGRELESLKRNCAARYAELYPGA